MRFAEAAWLWGVALAGLVGLVLAWGGLRHQHAVRRFGEPALVTTLKTARTGTRRAVRAVLLVLALALVFVAAAQPQYGRGTRIIPATNLDVVLVLDFSKSMYARDVSPSRIARAKVEVAELMRALGGARFGAVAFAGSPMSFPLTSDGAAVAQFFRGLEPNDMPVGGTAIARALDAARQLLERDPKSGQHERVVVLITDGEDLEGDPVAVARAMAKARMAVHVVQIGGRSPEPIPDVDEHGQMRGLRQDASGQLLMTSLSAEGEAQLAQVASGANGKLVRAAHGTTGVEQITRELRRLMTDELGEQVETIYADVYAYPLGLALLLLILEALIGTAPRRPRPPALEPPARRRRRKRGTSPAATAASALLCALSTMGCQAVDDALDAVFVRYSPVVDEAIAALGEGQSDLAVQRLTAYLETGTCDAGVIGTPERLLAHADAAFDLGLGLFAVGERLGAKFGEEPAGATPPAPGADDPTRRERIECALRVVGPVALDTSLPIALRARAHYLAGNLEFLRGEYRAAVAAYDAALRLIPGFPEPSDPTSEGAPDGIGRDAAHNRAIALRRLAEQPPPEDEQKSQSDPEQSQDDQGKDDSSKQDEAAGDEPNDAPQQGDDSKPDQPQDGDEPKSDDSDQSGNEPKPQDPQQEAGNPGDEQEPRDPKNPPDASESAAKPSEGTRQLDERLLDELERAPNFQELDARQNARRIRGRGSMEDK